MQTDIMTITLNPALDASTFADAVVPGPKLRCDAPLRHPGGGGINVARVIARLNGQARALVALGGATGAQLAGLMAAEGIAALPIDAPGETRQSLAVTDRATGGQYRFVLPGPEWAEADAHRALDAIVGAAVPNGLLVVSGSQPPGVPDAFCATLARRLEGTGARLIVDTSGAALRTLAQGTAGLAVLRMNAQEAEGLAGRPLPSRTDTARFASALVRQGAAAAVIVARGPDGSVLAEATGLWHVAAADVPVRSKIGAGDSFVGALTLALAQGSDVAGAMRHGAAAASATVTTEGTALCPPALVSELLTACELSRLEG
ncbi:hexose kinase [Aestuariicoccus sp. MJ-SS9]|uniref:1-phosphofructokinase family hexose kinase n=1 Tax=Aestuariicoccus sp. MJ-SS9 TaxID=3079855 RepID=UPI002912F689|nr:hexose kinase [Aestuariicoccus sp. MJ-SS9]MDU8909928.1 hexose kinase [Aestuariicoccus sp. MJ-SS9]